jgi:hypothetical protein
MNLIARINAELEYVKKTTKEGDSVDCYARTVEYILPIFAEFIKGIENPYITGIQSENTYRCGLGFGHLRSIILSELEKMK